jgi:hypothetical protein
MLPALLIALASTCTTVACPTMPPPVNAAGQRCLPPWEPPSIAGTPTCPVDAPNGTNRPTNQWAQPPATTAGPSAVSSIPPAVLVVIRERHVADVLLVHGIR